MNFLFGGNKQNQVSVADYKTQYLEPKTQHTLIDVRSEGEYKSGHVPNAVNIPLQEVANRLGDIPKDEPVILICASGNRSRQAMNFLKKQGYENVHNFKGGTTSWRIGGNPIE